MTDLSSIIDSCDPEDFTVIRESEGVVLDGIRQRGSADEEIDSSGVFHPATPQTLQRLDDNTRTREVLTGYTAFRLRIADIKTKVLADKIRLRDAIYQVHEVSDWLQGGFFEVLCVRVGQ